VAESRNEPSEEKPSLFWSIFLVAGANILIAIAFFVPSIWLWHVLGAIGLLDLLLVVFVLVGLKRHKETKDKDLSATTFSRKMFNIISGLLFAFLVFLFSPFLALFILLGVDFAFGFHEIAYVVFKRKTYFTDAFIALGRQSEPFKPYMASIMALFGFTIALSFQTVFFNIYAANFFPQSFGYVVVMVYIATILIWGIGDTAAYFAGTKYGKHKLPYNEKKSWEGFFANFAVGVGLGLIFFSPFVLSFVPTLWWILLALIGGLSGAFFESVDLHLDDNFVTVTVTGIILGLLIILI
jgi:dolichol kinase